MEYRDRSRQTACTTNFSPCDLYLGPAKLSEPLWDRRLGGRGDFRDWWQVRRQRRHVWPMRRGIGTRVRVERFRRRRTIGIFWVGHSWIGRTGHQTSLLYSACQLIMACMARMAHPTQTRCSSAWFPNHAHRPGVSATPGDYLEQARYCVVI